MIGREIRPEQLESWQAYSIHKLDDWKESEPKYYAGEVARCELCLDDFIASEDIADDDLCYCDDCLEEERNRNE